MAEDKARRAPTIEQLIEEDIDKLAQSDPEEAKRIHFWWLWCLELRKRRYSGDPDWNEKEATRLAYNEAQYYARYTKGFLAEIPQSDPEKAKRIRDLWFKKIEQWVKGEWGDPDWYEKEKVFKRALYEAEREVEDQEWQEAQKKSQEEARNRKSQEAQKKSQEETHRLQGLRGVRDIGKEPTMEVKNRKWPKPLKWAEKWQRERRVKRGEKETAKILRIPRPTEEPNEPTQEAPNEFAQLPEVRQDAGEEEEVKGRLERILEILKRPGREVKAFPHKAKARYGPHGEAAKRIGEFYEKEAKKSKRSFVKKSAWKIFDWTMEFLLGPYFIGVLLVTLNFIFTPIILDMTGIANWAEWFVTVFFAIIATVAFAIPKEKKEERK